MLLSESCLALSTPGPRQRRPTDGRQGLRGLRAGAAGAGRCGKRSAFGVLLDESILNSRGCGSVMLHQGVHCEVLQGMARRQ